MPSHGSKATPPQQYELKIWAWWIVNIVILVAFTLLVLDYNRPEAVPIFSAAFAVLAYIAFTREKGSEEDFARELQLDLINRIVIEHVSHVSYNERNAKTERLLVNYEIDKINHTLNKRIGLPMRPVDVHTSIQTIPEAFLDNVRSFRQGIERHYKRARQYATLEGVAVVYYAGLTVAGADFVRWYNG